MGDLLLQLFMNILGAANEPDTAHPISMRFDRGVGRFNHLWMRRKPQVIIGAKIQNGLTVHGDLGPLWTGNRPFGFIEAGSLNFLNFFPYSAYKIFIHDLKLKHKYNWRRLEPEAHRTPDRVK